MKTTLALLAVIGLISLTQPVVAAPSGSSDCAIQQPGDEPTMPPVKLAAPCDNPNCAVEQPDAPAIPPIPEDG